MTIVYDLHADNPQPRLIKQAAGLIEQGGLLAVPTDSSYAVIARLDDRDAAAALRRVRGLDDRHHLTLLCRDLTEIALFARIDNRQYRLLKAATPGPWTFILEATKEVPRRVSHPSRRTIGIRVPRHPVTLGLLEQFGAPLLSTTLIAEGQTHALNDAQEIAERFKGVLAGVLDSGACSAMPTTVIDLVENPPVVLRRGGGDPALLGLV
jgi:tRNA threonylcarbamoyl adenosine modification protein (Sua5/YciO/YrdC/YwlC family)